MSNLAKTRSASLRRRPRPWEPRTGNHRAGAPACPVREAQDAPIVSAPNCCGPAAHPLFFLNMCSVPPKCPPPVLELGGSSCALRACSPELPAPQHSPPTAARSTRSAAAKNIRHIQSVCPAPGNTGASHPTPASPPACRRSHLSLADKQARDALPSFFKPLLSFCGNREAKRKKKRISLSLCGVICGEDEERGKPRS